MNKLLWYKVTNSLYWILVAIWFGALVMTGTVAAIIFPALKSLDVNIPSYSQAGYTVDHWAIAAGHVMERVFFAYDLIQILSCTGIVVFTVCHFVIFKLPFRKCVNIIRWVSLSLLVVTVCWNTFVVAPRMNHNLRQHWDYALQGDVDNAIIHKEAFNSDHPQARFLMECNVFLLATLIIASAFSLAQYENKQSATT